MEILLKEPIFFFTKINVFVNINWNIYFLSFIIAGLNKYFYNKIYFLINIGTYQLWLHMIEDDKLINEFLYHHYCDGNNYFYLITFTPNCYPRPFIFKVLYISFLYTFTDLIS